MNPCRAGFSPPWLTQPTRPSTLILGWGNLSRGDDALGPLFVAGLLAQLPTDLRDQIEFLEDYQLQVEHALDLVGRKRVLLVDASLNCAAPFEVQRVQPRRDTSYTSHALSPEALLQVFVDVEGVPPPPVTLLAIRGELFELGAPMSEAAQHHLAAALAWGVAWVCASPDTVKLSGILGASTKPIHVPH